MCALEEAATALQAARARQVQLHLAESVYKVVSQKSIPAQICQLVLQIRQFILCYH